MHNNSIQLGHPHLGALVDRWAVPSWMPLANVYSVGDVLIALGTIVVIVTAMRPKPLSRRSARTNRVDHIPIAWYPEST